MQYAFFLLIAKFQTIYKCQNFNSIVFHVSSQPVAGSIDIYYNYYWKNL